MYINYRRPSALFSTCNADDKFNWWSVQVLIMITIQLSMANFKFSLSNWMYVKEKWLETHSYELVEMNSFAFNVHGWFCRHFVCDSGRIIHKTPSSRNYFDHVIPAKSFARFLMRQNIVSVTFPQNNKVPKHIITIYTHKPICFKNKTALFSWVRCFTLSMQMFTIESFG